MISCRSFYKRKTAVWWRAPGTAARPRAASTRDTARRAAGCGPRFSARSHLSHHDVAHRARGEAPPSSSSRFLVLPRRAHRTRPRRPTDPRRDRRRRCSPSDRIPALPGEDDDPDDNVVFGCLALSKFSTAAAGDGLRSGGGACPDSRCRQPVARDEHAVPQPHLPRQVDRAPSAKAWRPVSLVRHRAVDAFELMPSNRRHKQGCRGSGTGTAARRRRRRRLAEQLVREPPAGAARFRRLEVVAACAPLSRPARYSPCCAATWAVAGSRRRGASAVGQRAAASRGAEHTKPGVHGQSPSARAGLRGCAAAERRRASRTRPRGRIARRPHTAAARAPVPAAAIKRAFR